MDRAKVPNKFNRAAKYSGIITWLNGPSQDCSRFFLIFNTKIQIIFVTLCLQNNSVINSEI